MAANYELILKGATVVNHDGEGVRDLAVADGRIAAIGDVSGSAAETIDCRGLHVLPGVIDSHVHFLINGQLDATAQPQRVRSGGDVLQPVADDRLRQQGRGGGSVAGHVGGLAGDLLDHHQRRSAGGQGQARASPHAL